MAKIIIPANPSDDLEAQGLSQLDNIDLEITVEILEKLESTLRMLASNKVISLTDAAMLCLMSHQSDAEMLLKLAREAGEPIGACTMKAQPGIIH
jgi:hypothetical protein